MKVAWLMDEPDYIGGAELSARAIREAAPEGVEIVDVPPGELGRATDCEAACVFNSTTYLAETVRALIGKKVIRRWADVAPHDDPELKAWLLENATNVFSSERQRRYFGVEGQLLPAPIDLDAFRPPRQARRHRKGVVSIAAWMNPGKGAVRLREWSEANDPVTVYGPGPFAPHGPMLETRGPLEPEKVREALWLAETFVFLPTALDPFCRTVAEAWAAGCKLIVNRMVGCVEWFEKPEALETAAADFWDLL